MPNHRNVLHQITQILLRPEDHYGELTPAIANLSRLFSDIAGLDLGSLQHREDIHLPSGKAIGPVWAALCIQELLRTKRFLRGAYLGIKSALARFPVRPIHILYAGTGPFATLAIPLTTVFTPAEVKFTFLEVNPESIGYLGKIIAAFQAEEYVQEVIQCDAATYRVNPKDPIQMVITETMQNALQKEPQVAITLNLASQMAPGGILIPQNIRIDAALLSPQKDRERMTGTGAVTDCYRVLKTIFELNKNTQAPNVQESFSFPEVAVEIPPDLASEYPQMTLFTTIQVFEEEQLKPWECSLTLPKMIMRMDSAVNQGVGQNPLMRLSFQYRMNETPGFNWRLL
ncbi:MAG TPA: phytanoyl-CoA dioxygenase [Bacillota bacterium]|nr:phytanoyl-CoA dioxygenase [Bacillota bacterium]